MNLDLSVALIDVLKAAVGAMAAGWLGYQFWLKQYLQGLRQSYDLELRTTRLKAYEKVLESFEPFALYARREATYADARRLGEDLRSWYFSRGGLIMSTRTRSVYFLVQEALERVRAAPPAGLLAPPAMSVPDAPTQGGWKDLVDGERQRLKLESLSERVLRSNGSFASWETHMMQRILAWPFNVPSDDFVLLQLLGSSMRTAFIADLRSRDAALLDEMERS